jgi:hypothetical protein
MRAQPSCCGSGFWGFWGGQRPTGYVAGTGATKGTTARPEDANVGYPLKASDTIVALFVNRQ